MGNRQSKQNKTTKQSPSKYKPKKEKVKGGKVEPSEARQRSIGSSSRRRDPQPPTAVASVESRSLKKGHTVADTINPHATTTIPASVLSLEPNETTIYVAKNDDKIREETQKDVETEADLEPYPVTTTQALSPSHGSCTAEKDNKFKDKGSQEGPEPKSVGLENAQFPAQSVHATWQSESPTTSPAISTVLNSHCEEQTVVEVEEKKGLTVSDTSMSHSTVDTAHSAPESSGATAEASREEKRGKRTQEKSKSAQETPLKNGPRAQDGSNHASFKKTVQRKRHKRTGRYALTVDNVLRELKNVSWEKLSKGMSLSVGTYRVPGILFLPGSQRRKIEAEYATEDQRRNAAVQFWLVSDPYASWRRLITELDAYEEHAVAKQIHHYAEKLTDPTLTHVNISTVTATVPLEDNELGWRVLDISESKCNKIHQQSSIAAEERESLTHYYLNNSPYASWSHLAGKLYCRQHHDALSAVRRFIQTEPDPTLTLPNLTALLEKVDWDKFGRWFLDVPDATLDMIHSSGGDASQCRQKCWEVYLNEHPAPSWKRVANGLYLVVYPVDYHEELEVIQKKYLKGTAENQRQFEEAMKNGHIKAWLCKLLMYGHAGSGKTTSMEMIVGNKRPLVRESTPLATRPTTIYRVNLESEEWAKLTTLNDHKLLLARALIRGAPKHVDRLLATQSDDELSTNINPAPSKAETQIKVKDPASSGSSEPPVQGKPLLDSAEGESLELDSSDEDIEAEADAILESISTDEEFVKLMDQLSTSVDPLTAFRILEMIDCGGLPQFHDILPVFLRHLDFYVFVFRLCDQLDSQPLVEFYVDGKPVGVPIESSQTMEQLLQHCARSIHTYGSTSGSEGGYPKIMVLGTHADLEWKSEESREQKNKKILSLLLPNLEEQIIYHDVPSKQVVFPLNTLNPGREEERNIKKIRDILFRSSSVPPVDIPLRWFAFEILLKQMTSALFRGVLSREECFTVAMNMLYFEDDAAEFDAAIQYLHNLSVLFYYQDILPEVVFADPQIIYDKVSELVFARYQLTTNKPFISLTYHWLKFYEFALVTAEFLSQPIFNKHYVPGLFEPEHLIKLFNELLIFATFNESQLFVPALLRELDKKEVDTFRIPSNSSIPSLALEFPEGGPRKGLFCSLLSWLVSPNNDCPGPFSISTDSTRAPICLYRNCIQLDIPKSPATLTLIDAYTHFEVHVQVPVERAENFCRKLFPSIQKIIFKGLHKAALNLHYSNSTPRAALVCPCGQGGAHIATVNKDIGYWSCSLNKMECDKLSSFQILWIDSDDSDPEEEEHIAAVKTIMGKKGILDHTIVQGVFVGLARSGKDSLMKRLLGKELPSISPSSGVAENTIQVKVMKKSITVAANIEESTCWTEMDYDDEAIKLMSVSIDSNQYSKHQKQLPIQYQKKMKTVIEPSVTAPPVRYQSTCTATENMSTVISYSTSNASVNQTANSHRELTPTLNSEIIDHSIPNPLDILKEALESKGLEALKQHFQKTWSLYLTNTGGQMEFQEVLPLLVSGPSMFFFTFRLDRDLNEHYSVVYEHAKGESYQYTATCTTIEGILHTLASISAMGTFVYQGLQRKQVPLRPKVFFIGTHKDQLKPDIADSHIASVDNQLKEIIASAAHYRDIVEFSSPPQMIFTVNNLSKCDHDFQCIRSAVEQTVTRGEFHMTSPAHWLVFSLALRKTMSQVITYDLCYKIARQCGIESKDELNNALKFIHSKMGLVRYFPYEELTKIVITDPQFLFDKVTELIVDTFVFEKVKWSKKNCDGIFSMEEFQQKTDSKFDSVQFEKLLIHLRIAAPFFDRVDKKKKIFLPCVLTHANKSTDGELPSTPVPSLLIVFVGSYCPKGVPGALITYLMTNEMKSSTHWQLLPNKIFRDQISFIVGPHDTIIIKTFPTHFEINCIPESKFASERVDNPIEKTCKEVVRVVKTGIQRILEDFNYIEQFDLTFQCQAHTCKRDHPAQAIKDDRGCPSTLLCKNTGERFGLPTKSYYWGFGKSEIATIQCLTERHLSDLVIALKSHAHKWMEIGPHLGFQQGDLLNIAAKPLLSTDAPQSWLQAMLSEWLKRAPGDSRGSPSLNSLKFALNECNLGATASNLAAQLRD